MAALEFDIAHDGKDWYAWFYEILDNKAIETINGERTTEKESNRR